MADPEWDIHKSEIKRLYLTENKTLKSVVQIMEMTHGFRKKYSKFFFAITSELINANNIQELAIRGENKGVEVQKVQNRSEGMGIHRTPPQGDRHAKQVVTWAVLGQKETRGRSIRRWGPLPTGEGETWN
jgi:hypothetical protein